MAQLPAGAEHRGDVSAEGASQAGTTGAWAEGGAAPAPAAHDTSAWGSPGWITAPAEAGGSGGWDLDLPADLPTTGKWDEWNEFMYAAEDPPGETAAQLLPRQALPGDEDLFNFRDEMVGCLVVILATCGLIVSCWLLLAMQDVSADVDELWLQYGEGVAAAEESVVSGSTNDEAGPTTQARPKPKSKKAGRPPKDTGAETRAGVEEEGLETGRGRVAEFECVEEGLDWDEVTQ